MNSQRNRKKSRIDRINNTLGSQKSKRKSSVATHTKGNENLGNCINENVKEETSSIDKNTKNDYLQVDPSKTTCEVYKGDAIDSNSTEKKVDASDHYCECCEDDSSVNEKVTDSKKSKKKKNKRVRNDNIATVKNSDIENGNNNIDSDECSNDSRGSISTDYDGGIYTSEHNFISDKVLTLNVGGTIVKTLQSTLLSMPSIFSVWINDNFKSFPRDANNNPYLDRDVESFRLILNYLRGYGLPSKLSDLVLLAEDAMYYQLTSLQNEIGLDTPSIWRFNAGPGVNQDGSVFSMQDILGVCGTEPLSVHQTHTIVFKIDKCELVTLGVITLGDVKENMQLQRQRNSVSYCSTGELVRYFADEPVFTPGTSYKAQDLITITVKFVKSTNVPEELDCQELIPSTLVLPTLESSELQNVTLNDRNEQSSATSIDEFHVDQSTLWHSRAEQVEIQTNSATTESRSRLISSTHNNNRCQLSAAEQQRLTKKNDLEKRMEPNLVNSSN